MLTKKTPQTKSELTKDMVFQKTFEIISEKGFEAVNHREVAQACDLSVGIVYKYLGPSKDQMGVLMEYIVTEGYSILDKIPDGLSPLEKIQLNQRTNLEFFLSQPGYALLFLHFYINSRFDDDLHKWNLKLTRLAESRIVEMLPNSKKSQHPHFARTLHSLLVGEIIKFVSLKLKNKAELIDDHIKQVEFLYNSVFSKS